jgi:uncharacterized cupin superfamily protein
MSSTSSTAIAPSIRGRDDAHHWVACPVNPAWVLEGSPVARIEHLSSSADGTASTYFWECTAGRFNWFYTFDETLHILEGSVKLKFADGRSRCVAAGDVVFFPKGSSAEWTVDSYIRKLAFCRTALPDFLVSARDTMRRVKRLGRAPAAGSAAGIFSSG